MHRQIVYPGQVPLETDLLNTNRHTLIALGMLTQAMLGTGTYVDGLPCTPGAGLAVSVGLGSIYTLSAIDTTAYSSLPANATQIAKQGILLAPVSLVCPAPITTGQSINYLVEVQFQEVDGDAAVLPYYNSANPTIAWSGPGGSGNASATTRKDICAVQVKAGVATATGAQVTPAADAGWTGLYVVTVAYAATTISAGNISQLSSAPFLKAKLPFAAGTNLANVFTQQQTVPDGTLPQHAINLGQVKAFGMQYVAANTVLQTSTYLVDTSGGSFVLTLPLNPLKGDCIRFIDMSMSWDVFPWVLARNGKTIMKLSEDLRVNVVNQEFSIIYNGTDWRLI